VDLWDVNVLVYAHRTDLPEFERFRRLSGVS
jgi:predicted nucleic acid-binding protein